MGGRTPQFPEHFDDHTAGPTVRLSNVRNDLELPPRSRLPPAASWSNHFPSRSDLFPAYSTPYVSARPLGVDSTLPPLCAANSWLMKPRTVRSPILRLRADWTAEVDTDWFCFKPLAGWLRLWVEVNLGIPLSVGCFLAPGFPGYPNALSNGSHQRARFMPTTTNVLNAMHLKMLRRSIHSLHHNEISWIHEISFPSHDNS